MEIWKDIQGYEGSYQVSNLGRVKSVERITREGNHRSEKQMKLQKTKRGYLTVILTKDGNQKLHYVHRLVGIAFIPNPTGKEQINHINEQKEDNRVENLRWVTRKENQNNHYTLEKMKNAVKPVVSEETRKKQKLNWLKRKDLKDIYEKISKKVICLDTLEVYLNSKDAENKTPAKAGAITRNCNKNSKRAGGLRWMYYTEYLQENL